MYTNISEKVKMLAQIVGFGGLAIFSLAAIVMLINRNVGGFFYMLIMAAVSFASSWPLYGFGVLIEKVSAMSDGKAAPSSTESLNNDAKTTKFNTLKRWHDQGLINDEEYKQKLLDLLNEG